MGEEGLKRIEGLRDDDIVVYSDADEIADTQVLSFLKLYDGYTEPISFAYRYMHGEGDPYSRRGDSSILSFSRETYPRELIVSISLFGLYLASMGLYRDLSSPVNFYITFWTLSLFNGTLLGLILALRTYINSCYPPLKCIYRV